MRRVLSIEKACLLTLGLFAVLWAVPVGAEHPLTQSLRMDIRVQQRLLENDIGALERHQKQMAEVMARAERLSADLLRAEDQGESLDSLRLRNEDLRQVEAELMMHLMEAQRLRSSLLDSRVRITEMEAEVRRLEGEVGPSRDPLTGTWRVVIEPGGQDGVLYLSLNGTLVEGTYRLSGGWTGSMRGTLVAGKVRLERVDAQVGFSAIFYGRVRTDIDPPRLEGRWEATQLATGLPSGGTWIAEKETESELR